MDAIKNILIGEDERLFRELLSTELGGAGHKVKVVENGKEVLEELKKQKPNLLILDLIMPVMDGFETLEAIRANDEYKDLKVIVLSALGQQSDIDHAKELGADDFLVKSSLSLNEVVEQISKHL
jgi:CheY-like chemotaxis protein